MITPLGHTILIEIVKVSKATDWGFDLQIDQEKEDGAQMVGTIKAIGSQAWKAFSSNFDGEPWAKVGDKVAFAKFAGRWVHDPEDMEGSYMLMNDDDIRAIITESNEQ